jgi:hypothetical protein
MMRTLALLTLIAALGVRGAETITGGSGLIYLGGRPNKIFIVDEASEKVAGQIECKTGAPSELSLSPDRKRLYILNMSFEDVEIADIASRQVIGTFRLSEGNKKMRIFGLEPDPSNRYVVLMVKPVTKLTDRFEIGDPTLYQYDLKEHKIARTIPWPEGEEHEFGMGARYSPDGKLLYLFGENVIVYETTDFKQVDKWELSRPIEDGFGRINLNMREDLNEEPGFYTGVFHVQDAVQHRSIMGIARVNLAKKDVDFYPLGPATELRSFSLAPGERSRTGCIRRSVSTSSGASTWLTASSDSGWSSRGVPACPCT